MTVPAITRFVTRAEWGAKAPRSVSLNVVPDHLTYHYLGATPIRIRSLADGIRVMKSTQAFHMGPDRGWVDFAYSFAFCDLGNVYAGRGFGVRTAAQGTNTGNDRSLAALYLGGGDQVPTPEAVAAAAWIAQEVRRLAQRKSLLRGHRDWKTTGCPGEPQARLLTSRAYEPTVAPPPPPEDIMASLDDLSRLLDQKLDPVLARLDDLGGDETFVRRARDGAIFLGVPGSAERVGPATWVVLQKAGARVRDAAWALTDAEVDAWRKTWVDTAADPIDYDAV